MALHLQLIGYLLVLLALIHIGFPTYFGWKKDLAGLSLINRQMMYVHTFFIFLTVLLMGLLCIHNTADLLLSPLGHVICLGFSFFWAVRLFFQLFVYSPRLWQGKIFETAIHILFTLLWTYFSWVFLVVGLYG